MILVTGAGGFVGRRLCETLHSQGLAVRAVVRTALSSASWQTVAVGDIARFDDWRSVLEGCDAVVHLAARAHVLDEKTSDPLSLFRSANVIPTVELARASVEVGVRRFVYMSSIGVLGNSNSGPFNEDSPPAPTEPYAVSKHEAELRLREIEAASGLDVVILRPPLVYGPDAPGNFGKLVETVRRGIPLPLGAVNNKRTLIALDNLVDIISVCLAHPKAAHQTFLAADAEDVSTAQLIRLLSNAMGVRTPLVPVPFWMLKGGASLVGKGRTLEKVCGNLQVDISKASRVLGWKPPVGLDEGFRAAVRRRIDGETGAG